VRNINQMSFRRMLMY